MARKKQSPPMGHNPLAWLAENETHATTANHQEITTENSPLENMLESPVESAIDAANATENQPTTPSPISIETVENKGWTTITLPAVLTLSELSAFHAQLTALIGRRIRLSGKEVTRIDTASLQVLLILMRDAETTVGWLDASPYLCQAAHILGLTHELNLSEFNS
ncbi:STAS domain-containing protein [Thioflexithrix psekupsensis]|uniref:MlaB-like STAS domain-containing protein n=1 Tax=Thioflexithrix psekupsensis TaxID=1570016 RepID=A0A251X599_9GAMM|nr:STAS domain-containing protein [Thioflexithrix psekupsensis]OUD12566.1 hypothetical protein TPSD3_15900 [Thioflexithrix psekupsensis]